MSLHLVTGHKGQAHVTAEDHGALNAGTFGTGEVILNIGEKFRALAITSNTVRIYDGELLMQGRHVRIARDTYEEVSIENGAQGMKRNDLIVVRYTKEVDLGYEKAEFAVLKGVETEGTAVDPTPTTGDILSEACLLHEMPLYRVKLNGINVESVDLLAEVMTKNGLLFDQTTDYVVEQGTANNGKWTYRKWNSGMVDAWFKSVAPMTCTNNEGSLFYGGEVRTSYPFTIYNAVPTVLLGQQCYAFITQITEELMGFRPCRGKSEALTANDYCIHIHGRWR